jgi:hypothetical protein
LHYSKCPAYMEAWWRTRWQGEWFGDYFGITVHIPLWVLLRLTLKIIKDISNADNHLLYSTARIFRSDSSGEAVQWLAIHPWKLRSVVITHSFAFSASRHLSTLVSMLELSPSLPSLLLLRVGGLSHLNTRSVTVLCVLL